MLFRSDRKSTRLNSSHDQISYAVSLDRKSTRLNSSHDQISYAVFCLKKKEPAGRASRTPGVVAGSPRPRRSALSSTLWFFFFNEKSPRLNSSHDQISYAVS